MTRRIVTLILAAVALFSMNATVPDCVVQMMKSGDFIKVGQYIEQSKELSDLEKDSLIAIMQRIRKDFNLTFDEGTAKIQEKFTHVTRSKVNDWVSKKYIETKTIDGETYMFRKTVSNLDRLVPELSASRRVEAIKEDSANMINAISAMTGNDRYAVKVRFSIEIKPDVVPNGMEARVWMPFPIENGRQSDVKLISANCDKYEFSKGRSLHNTVYMERKAKEGKPILFELEFSYVVTSQYFSPEYILKNKKPYDKDSELYKQYTSTEYPQIILTDRMKRLASEIVGNETDPLKQASLIYDWIDAYFPWAGAREYSTIENLAQYVLDNGHGDCGQVSLLYITLLRSLGIPARWESGWMLHPGKVGMHDWAEVYYEGVGWVPVDMSFGLIEVSDNKNIRDFYKTGIDQYRFASNRGVGGALYPAKKFVRSETVDFQLGEVEYDGGNLFYYKDWTPKFELISIEKLK